MDGWVNMVECKTEASAFTLTTMRFLVLPVLLLSVLLSGCNLIYKPEVRQGNPVSPEAVATLKPGMTKRQIRLILGTPPINDVFHPDRWDYVNTVSRIGEPAPPPPRLTLYFENDALVAASGELAPAALVRPDKTVPAPTP